MSIVRNRKALEAECPVCGSMLNFQRRPGCGQFLTCHYCDSKLTVRRRTPIVLTAAFIEPWNYTHFGEPRVEYPPDDWDYEEYVGGGEYCDVGLWKLRFP